MTFKVGQRVRCINPGPYDGLRGPGPFVIHKIDNEYCSIEKGGILIGAGYYLNRFTPEEPQITPKYYIYLYTSGKSSFDSLEAAEKAASKASRNTNKEILVMQVVSGFKMSEPPVEKTKYI